VAAEAEEAAGAAAAAGLLDAGGDVHPLDGAGHERRDVGLDAVAAHAVSELAAVAAAPAGEGPIGEDGAGVRVSGRDRRPARRGADALGEGDRRLGLAVAELADVVRAPAPELPGAQAAGVPVAGADGVPVLVGRRVLADARRHRVRDVVAGPE